METLKPFEFKLSSLNQLDIIDKLRDLGVGDLVALPQVSASHTLCHSHSNGVTDSWLS